MALLPFPPTAPAVISIVLLALTHGLLHNSTPALRSGKLDTNAVKVLVLTEALCPDCKDYVLNQLVGVYSLLGDEVMELKLVPFGNAIIDNENKTVVCQHDVGECDANSYEQCTIAAFPDPTQHLPMIACLDETLPMGRHDTVFPSEPFEHCAVQAGLPFPRIQGCHGSPELAWRFQWEAAGATPDYHEYVPWVEIDGDHIDEEADLLAQICTAFIVRGGSHPACETMPKKKDT